MIPWAHQTRAVAEVLAAIESGHRRILLTCPTGGGKSRIMGMLAEHFQDGGVVLYTNRKLLVTQTSGVFDGLDLEHGVRSAGHEENKTLKVQVSSIQTEHARVNKKKTWQLHKACLVLVDEAHLIKAEVAKGIFDKHIEDGAIVVGFTATPLELETVYDFLIVASQPSELRACGALVSATHYGADEPDMAALKKIKKLPTEGDELSENMVKAAMMTPSLFGRVSEWFDKLNPERKPTLLFAPGVAESLWFAEKFWKKGISAAHMAAGEVWFNGKWITGTSPEEEQLARATVLSASKSGECAVLCNRFLLREGVDAPWLEHGIFATIFGSLQSYLQSGGRLLRASPSTGKTGCTIQDHGGNWWRHGSLNTDRHWDIRYTASMVYGLRAERLRKKKEQEPWLCQECGQIRKGTVCECGHVLGPRKSRPVVTMQGEMKEMVGDIFKKRKTSGLPGHVQLWEKMYWRSFHYKKGRTFRAAMQLFALENDWWYPDENWPLMPVEDEDFFRLVRDVPRSRLR